MTRIPSGPLLLVSPHLDDAVLSCAALIARLEPLDVLTVAAGAPDPPVQGWWDLETGFASSAESVPTRLREDETAFAGTSHRRTYLPLLEVQHQEGGRTPTDAHALSAAVTSWLAGERGTVALPAGAGCRQSRISRRLARLAGREPCSPPQHPDHLWVRDVVLHALAETDALPLLYEELPYLFGGRADRVVEEVAGRNGSSAERIELPVDRNEKARRISAYSSQIAHLSDPARPLDDPETIPARECYWLLTRRSSNSV